MASGESCCRDSVVSSTESAESLQDLARLATHQGRQEADYRAQRR